jgi:D-cysteine desulfhydrase
MNDALAIAYPRLAARLPKVALATLPTPVSEKHLRAARGPRVSAVKHDNLTGEIYGGNKVRKLEYLLGRARNRRVERIATFGTVASNHALATALYAASLGLECTCLLSHQSKTPLAAAVLNSHLQIGTEIVCLGGKRAERVQTMRRTLQGRRINLVPAGGSNWLGVVGFISAALELARQISAGEVAAPDRLYVANGTMGTAAGLALGLALAGLPTEVQAIRVTHEFVANPRAMQRLVAKSAFVLNRIDPSIPRDLANRVRLTFRDEFFAGGYAMFDEDTERAVSVAGEELGLVLETTYTGKAMAAMLHDLDQDEYQGRSVLFWNTFNSRPLPAAAGRPADNSSLPAEFLRYFD